MKRMGAKEFVRLGLLHEVNRKVLHPLGLALEVVEDDITGAVTFGGVHDVREDPEGMYFGTLDRTKMDSVKRMEDQRRDARIKAVGYWIQGDN